MALIIKPQTLAKGGHIGVFSPSSAIPEAAVERGRAFLEKRGYNVTIHPQTLAQNGRYAGTVQERVTAFHDLLTNSDIDAIIASRGGSGALFWLDKINYDLWQANPKIILGFSDLTALHHAGLNRAGTVTFHGPMLCDFQERAEFKPSAEGALKFLSGEAHKANLLDHNTPHSPIKTRTTHAGQAEGRLVGGNLTLLIKMLAIGAPYTPQMAGNILFIEEVEELHYRVDRALAALFMNRSARAISGLIIGRTEINHDENRNWEITPQHELKAMINRILSANGLDIPVVINAPFTHQQPNRTIPHGVMVKLNAEEDNPSLHLLESPFDQ